ncbi:hypothetical protein GCM10009550_44890 [Actinocorallia libanotica]|uniref:Acyl-CoA dehydrogenase/oxidase C-terminal domain-containing protein n=2 Tax=Actinocorallia libanotica TaxID=46162 RepID=A0ABN1RHR9_9ACTN
MVSQARPGPCRIHRAMRAIGMAGRALEPMGRRAAERVAFGGPPASQDAVGQQIAESRTAIEQARSLTLETAWPIDGHGAEGARSEIAAVEAVAPRVAFEVLDGAIQVHGGAGVGDDTPLAAMYTWAGAMRIFDGPDEARVRTVARQELRPYLS